MNNLEKRLSIIEEKLGIVNGKTKLEVGKWYWVDRTNVIPNDKKALVYYQGNNVPTYGFDHLGIYTASYGCHDTFNNYNYIYTLATKEEVKEALSNHAISLGIKNENTIQIDDFRILIKSNPKFGYDEEYNTLYVYCRHFYLHNGSNYDDIQSYFGVFYNGKWFFELIEQPIDKFSELKEAHKNGAVIQVNYDDGRGYMDTDNPKWNNIYEYRIKPQQSSLEQDIQQLKDKYKQYKFTITIEDNI